MTLMKSLTNALSAPRALAGLRGAARGGSMIALSAAALGIIQFYHP
jgi:hypothetical protein